MEGEPTPQEAEANSATTTVRKSKPVIWSGILLAYVTLFVFTGYIAFFREPYNPAANPNKDVVATLTAGHPFSAHLIEALKQEGAAFQARKELAAQSFNVVLGALLGFLSASAVRETAGTEVTGSNEDRHPTATSP